jgi:hypothetical protein
MKRVSPVLIARDLARVTQGAWWTALDSWQRSHELAEQSRERMKQSEDIIRWCEMFGPKPEDNGRQG